MVPSAIAACKSREETEIRQRPIARAERSPRPYRLAAIFHRPHPYFCKFFQRLAAHPEVDLTAYFYSDLGIGTSFDAGFQQSVQWDTDLLSGYKNHFLRNCALRPDLSRFWGTFHPGLLAGLRRGYDAAILHGWWGFSSWLAASTILLRGIPLLIHSDKSAVEPMGAPHGRLRDITLPYLFQRAAGFLVVGQCNIDFYRKMGVPSGKMFPTPLAVDNAFFQSERKRLEPQREAIRRSLGIPSSAPVFLYAGRLDRQKGVMDLLQAFAALPVASAHLILAGDGPQRGTLEAYAKARAMARVHFAGLQNYSQLPSIYAISDVFVLPSLHEPWGAVVNEAMNFAMPIVASRVVGAAADLVADGVNGLLFDPGNVGQLTERLQWLLCQPALCKQMGGESARRITGWNYDCGVEGVLAALRSVVPRGDAGFPESPVSSQRTSRPFVPPMNS